MVFINRMFPRFIVVRFLVGMSSPDGSSQGGKDIFMIKKDYFVTLEDGTKVPVSAEIYQEYYRPQWREEKCQQRDAKRLLSSDYEYSTSEGETSTMYDYLADPKPTPEEVLVAKEEKKLLYQAIEILSAERRELVQALFIEGKTERDYAAETGIARTTINYQRKKALQEMRKYMEKNM